MKKLILSVLVFTLVFAVGCAGDQTTWDKVQDEGKLTIGMSADYKPFEYTDENGEIVGFDADIAQAIGEKLGVEVEFVDTAFSGLIPGLKSNKYDLIMSAMTITEKREKAVDFTNQYFNAGQVVAVMDDNNSIQGVKDLEGKKVGVQLGTTGDLEVSDMDNIEQIKRYEKIPQAFIDLRNGRIDAIVNDLPVTAAYIMKHPEVKMVGEPFTSEHYGIATRPGDEELLKKVNGALKELKEDGTYDEVYNKWFKQ
ncbi:basic amino acid ABC transporter substrate-binding protein [Halanaerobacter jeridensis]|uniref:Polar amino acid transport system substrate-binding protein n=1 Tax=Halanaerobacter jeridensis TaxID=706427 RepID=A0A938XUV1_9FIRM|nr:basic amino acid ABC transporter substrate-binding protein [Halanaerobacter jeridensis]MBM7557284.1 polar amino acid transport system substrate-binding protein [Halanaerobacter jeridensis]